MATITDDAVCIRRWDFSETSQTLSLFCREHGVIRGLAKGAKRAKGAFSGGIDLLTRGQVAAIVKPGVELATFTSWHLIDLYRGVRRQLAANRAAIYMADLIHHMTTSHDPHPKLYDEFASALAELGSETDGGAAAIGPTLLRFQWRLLTETGYQPQLDRDARTGGPLPDGATLGFSAAAGGTVAEAGAGVGADTPADTWRVRRETIELLRKQASDQPTAQAPSAVIERANRLLAAYVRQIVGQEPPSMRWAFPGPL